MEQIVQQLKSGEITIQKLPWPKVGSGMVLVRNHYSLISTGTEGSTTKTARKSLIGKAKERPEQVKQVLDTLRNKGPVQTYRAVMKKLDAYSPLGYSSAGEVIEVGSLIREISVGDKVACAGAGYANHSEVVCVPQNLCVKLQPSNDLRKASYNTVGAIALQGIRQADLRIGETCAVIGLGLIGQLTCLLLKASSVKVIGIDINSSMVEIALKHCVDKAFIRKEPGLAKKIIDLTEGIGVDTVIITAGTHSLDPINFAGHIVRKKGRVVIVGAAPTGFDRDPYWYKKELELRMSCSYGPGRYDTEYEEKGIDYPVAYVRWTQKRNMQAFQELVHSDRIDIDYLTTHEFPLEEAAKAYDMIVNRSEPFLGIIFKYDLDKPIKKEPITVNQIYPMSKVSIAFIGAGNYAQQNLLPYIPRNDKDVTRAGIMTNSGTTSKRVAEKFNFQFCTSEPKDIFENNNINTVFIATRHNSHAEYVKSALRAGKHVFVEKPLCLTEQELSDIKELYNSSNYCCQLMVGFNRRFAPHAVELKKHLDDTPVSMLYRVNAGSIPRDSWIQDKEIGGGRIVGEVCHFIDFLTWLCGALPKHVHAIVIPDPNSLNDTVSVNLQFANGSIGSLSYFSNGSKKVPKEYLEVYSAGLIGIIRDFKVLDIHSSVKSFHNKKLIQDKGQAQMMIQFLQQLKIGGEPLISPEEIFTVTQACFAILKSIRTRESVSIE
jgi:predicted dehydrogenase/threonine dehydrogenase-like Zn-dependent dehydrogenase